MQQSTFIQLLEKYTDPSVPINYSELSLYLKQITNSEVVLFNALNEDRVCKISGCADDGAANVLLGNIWELPNPSIIQQLNEIHQLQNPLEFLPAFISKKLELTPFL